jgi:lipopolysaccharide transport system ATP-binding protein
MEVIKNLCKKCVLLENGELKFFGETNQTISEYTKKNFLYEPLKKITPKNHIRGTYESKIENVKISNSQGLFTNSFLINEPFFFEIDYLATEKSREISFWVLFTNKNGSIVANSFQKDQKELINNQAGNKKIKISFEDISLMPGSYMVTMGIFAHETLENFVLADYVEPAQSLEIIPIFADGSKFDGRLGAVGKKAKWTQIT